jgi:hypothetical protein
MHILEALAKLVLVPYETILELMLPQGPVGLAKAVEPSR